MSISKSLAPQHAIVNGPNRDRLIDAFKYAYDSDKVSANFTVAISYNPVEENGKCIHFPTHTAQIERMTINTIQHEDGSGESFHLSGYCAAYPERFYKHYYKFEAYYNAKTRTGTIRFEET